MPIARRLKMNGLLLALALSGLAVSLPSISANADEPSVDEVVERVNEVFIAPGVRDYKRGFQWYGQKRIQFIGPVSESIRAAFHENIAALNEVTGDDIVFTNDAANVFVVDVQNFEQVTRDDLPVSNDTYSAVGGSMSWLGRKVRKAIRGEKGITCSDKLREHEKDYLVLGSLFIVNEKDALASDIFRDEFSRFLRCFYRYRAYEAPFDSVFVFDAALDSLTCLDEATLRTWADHRMRPSLPKDELQDLIRQIAGEALANRLEHSPLCGEQ